MGECVAVAAFPASKEMEMHYPELAKQFNSSTINKRHFTIYNIQFAAFGQRISRINVGQNMCKPTCNASEVSPWHTPSVRICEKFSP